LTIVDSSNNQNIASDGTFKLKDIQDWSAGIQLYTLGLSIYEMLQNPDDQFIIPELKDEYENQPELFYQKAVEMTQKYGKGVQF